jgi:hypothetical protein
LKTETLNAVERHVKVCQFPIRNALRSELNRTHYRLAFQPFDISGDREGGEP